MTRPRRTTARLAFAGALLVVVGLGCWALYWLRSGTEDHSYSRNPIPPTTVHITLDKTYGIAIPGGVQAEQDLGLDPGSVRCTVSAASGATNPLPVTAEGTDTKATNQIASFLAPFTGRAHVQCQGLPPVFVDNADDASADVSGIWLVLATIALTVGVPLVISALRSAGRPRAAAPVVVGSAVAPGEDEEIEGFVERTRRGAADREVGDGDGGDVGA